MPEIIKIILFWLLDSIEIDSKRYDLVQIDKPECPFIIMEILSKDKNIIRGVHIIKMESKNQIRLVRIIKER